jgi:hypothetical protein
MQPFTKLKDYATSKKDMKKGTEISPEENYRLRNEDIYGDESNPQAFGKVSPSKDSISSSSTLSS